MFSHAAEEIQLTLMVDTKTGKAKITHLDNQPIVLKAK